MAKSFSLKATIAGFLLGNSFATVIYIFYQSSNAPQPVTELLPRPSGGIVELFDVSLPSKGDKFSFTAEVNRQVPNLTTPSDGLTTCPKHLNSTIARRLNCQRRLPNVIGIGVQKCGTSALSFFLESHPHLAHSKPEEVHFWMRYTSRSLGWYKKQMPISSKYQLTMEKSPSYWREEQVPLTIKDWMPPDTKFIVAIRDPVVRAVSAYVHLKVAVSDPKTMINRPLRPGETCRRYMNTTFESSVIRPDGEIMHYNSIIYNGIYVKRFRHWLSVFPRDRFFVIDGNEFSRNPLPILKEIEVFLGLPKYFDESKIYFDESKGFYCRRGHKKDCMGDGKGRSHPALSAELEQRLREFYHPYNLEMEKLVGQKFSWT